MPGMSDLIKDPAKRKMIVDDCTRLIEEEVAAKSGMTGLLVKGVFATVKALKPGMIPTAVHHLLDDFVSRIDPFHTAWEADGRTPGLPDYFSRRSAEIADALLGVTDDRARRSDNKTLKSAYDKLRPQGKKHVQEAVPRLGRLVQKHLG